MPRTTITPENMVGGDDDRYQRLKLKEGERARIWLPPEAGTQTHQPWREWTHELKAPVIENGEAKKETRQRQDGSTFEDYKKSFISQPICLGDYGKLMERGVDVDNCPACEAAQRMGNKEFRPKIRYASIAVKFTVVSGSWDIQKPFSAGLFIWSYPGGRAKLLSEIFKAEGRDLCMYDLRLGPCEKPEAYQKYEIQALGSRQPAWQEHVDYMRELLTTPGNLPSDDQLQLACGKVTARSYMAEDVKRAEQLWARAEGAGAAAPDTMGANFGGAAPADLGAGLQSLLGSAGAAPATPAAAPATAPVIPTPAAAPAPAMADAGAQALAEAQAHAAQLQAQMDQRQAEQQAHAVATQPAAAIAETAAAPPAALPPTPAPTVPDVASLMGPAVTPAAAAPAPTPAVPATTEASAQPAAASVFPDAAPPAAEPAGETVSFADLLGNA